MRRKWHNPQSWHEGHGHHNSCHNLPLDPRPAARPQIIVRDRRELLGKVIDLQQANRLLQSAAAMIEISTSSSVLLPVR
jgi:hypothetical protein